MLTAGMLAARIRDLAEMTRHHVGDRRDLTIRSWKSTVGWQGTELAKILRGDGPRWYLYCWFAGDRIAEWMLVDVDVLLAKNLHVGCRPIANPGDGGRTKFIAIPASALLEAGAIRACDLQRPTQIQVWGSFPS